MVIQYYWTTSMDGMTKQQRNICSLTSAVIIYHSHGLPLEKVDQVQDGPAEGREVWIEANVEDVSVVRYLVLPFGLDVWNPQCIANGLDSIGRGAV